MAGLGRKFWVIAEGYIPGTSTGPAPEMTSHETVCMLNPGRTDAKVEISPGPARSSGIGEKILNFARRSGLVSREV